VLVLLERVATLREQADRLRELVRELRPRHPATCPAAQGGECSCGTSAFEARVESLFSD
jgi:hypothetical protein